MPKGSHDEIKSRKVVPEGDGKPRSDGWQEIALQITVETDPAKMLELCEQLNNLLRVEEERQSLGKSQSDERRRLPG